jgi:diacylglycerol kinase family enzyme
MELFANESAGLGGAAAATISRELHRAGLSAQVRAVTPQRLPAAIRAAALRGGAVGVCGGDGTLMAAANVLAGSGAALAPVPTGTLNHFARRAGIDDIPAAARAILAGRTIEVPVGVLDDRIFLNTATFGLYADIVRRRERLRPWLTKWPAAAVALATRLLTMRRLRVTLDVGGERLERLTPLVWVGVGWGSFPRVHEAPEHRASPDLEIVVLRPRGMGVVDALDRRPFTVLPHSVQEILPPS